MKFSTRLNSASFLFSIVLMILSLGFQACKKDDELPNQSSNNTPTPNNVCQNDQEGDMIESVVIGTQEWMLMNLNATCYQDGTPIPNVTDAALWSSLDVGAWCWYNNDSATYAATYGKLYNWYAIAGIHDEASLNNPSLRKKLAPAGWHVPTDSEWTLLIDFLDSDANGGSWPGGNESNEAGGMLKSQGTIQEGNGLWLAPNVMASNSSGFSGVPGGSRSGGFGGIGASAGWWASTESGPDSAWHRWLTNDSGTIYKEGSWKYTGRSVRCVKD
jgi:uncharacterized protein (TIGR02145 family)